MDPLNVLTGDYTLTSLKPCDLSCCSKTDILKYFENSYNINESLFTVLAANEAFYMCPDRLRLPLIFYYTHTAVVYWNKMLLAGLVQERININIETMFETGVDEHSWDDTEHFHMGGSFKWPELNEVVDYRREVRRAIRQVIADMPLELPVDMDSPWWGLFMGMEHERIHTDTSSVLIQQLPIHLLRKPKDWNQGPTSCGSGAGDNKMVDVPLCNVTIGKPVEFPSYGWDCDYPESNRCVPPFEASRYLITNGEFMDFVVGDGYKREELWTKEGWQWRNFRKAKHPIFWICEEGCLSNCSGVLAGYSHCEANLMMSKSRNVIAENNNDNTYTYRLRTLCEEIQMPFDWPVEVNYHEAKAFCKWRGPEYRLMTEAEHHAIRGNKMPVSRGVSADIVHQDDQIKKCNTNLVYCSTTPVNMYPPNDAGFCDVFGNTWELLEDHFNGLPASTTHHLYDDFSTTQYGGRHNMILGGCWLSTGAEASCFSRCAYRRHFNQHAGFRLVKSLEPTAVLPVTLIRELDNPDQEVCLPAGTQVGPYAISTNSQFDHETNDYLIAQIQDEYVTNCSLYSELAELCRATLHAHGGALSKACDVHTGCGKLSFELSKFMENVCGIDYCESFLNVAETIQQNGAHKIVRCNGECHAVELPEGAKPSRITFKQFTWIPNELMNFDLVVLQGIDRVMNKKAWLLRLWEIIVPNGVIIIVSKEGYGANHLGPHIENRLNLIESRVISIVDSTGKPAIATTTVWRRKSVGGNLGGKANNVKDVEA